MTVFTPATALAGAQSADFPIATDGGVGIGGSDVDVNGLVVFLLTAAALLIAGCFLAHLRNSTFRGTFLYMLHGRTVANIGIVFIAICTPIVWVSFCAFQATNSIESVAPSLIPIFSSGLALEHYANRVVSQAEARAASESIGEATPKHGVNGERPPSSR